MSGLKAPTLDEAALNEDDTYDGARALSWLSEALHPGAGMTVDEVQRIWAEVKVMNRKGAQVPVVPRLPFHSPSPNDANPVVAVCGECHRKLRHAQDYGCPHPRCPFMPELT